MSNTFLAQTIIVKRTPSSMMPFGFARNVELNFDTENDLYSLASTVKHKPVFFSKDEINLIVGKAVLASKLKPQKVRGFDGYDCQIQFLSEEEKIEFDWWDKYCPVEWQEIGVFFDRLIKVAEIASIDRVEISRNPMSEAGGFRPHELEIIYNQQERAYFLQNSSSNSGCLAFFFRLEKQANQIKVPTRTVEKFIKAACDLECLAPYQELATGGIACGLALHSRNTPTLISFSWAEGCCPKEWLEVESFFNEMISIADK